MTTPTAASCAEVRLALGVYVLGAIDPAERAAVDGHVAACEGCRDELAALAGLPGLLGRLDEEAVSMLAPPADADPSLIDRVLATAARRRRTARQRTLAVAAAAVLLAGAGAGAVGYAVRHEPGPPASPAAVRLSSSAGPVRAQVALTPKAWGTAMDLRLTGVAGGQRCRMVADGADGSAETAASWQATYAGAATVTGATALPMARIRALRVVAADGRTLVTVRR